VSASVQLGSLIRPVLSYLWTEHRVPNGPAAEAMMLAIGLQESRFIHRDQVVPGKAPGQVGPATGFWQFEKGGGVAGVMQHASTADIARHVATASGVAFDREVIWRSFATPAGDQLAAAFARLLLFSDPRALPAPTTTAEEEAWQFYLRNWRPGKPHRHTWGGFWSQALSLVAGGGETPPAAAPGQPDGLAALAARVDTLERRMAAMARAVTS
jgi:hypothetical protein